jgi:hypothetical protein
MFLACAAVATIGLSAATPAMATFCTQPINATITVVSVPPGAPAGTVGACPVKNDDLGAPKCSSQGEWTGIKYATTGLKSTDLVSTLVTANNLVAPNQIYLFTGYSLYPAGTSSSGGGDTNTGLGRFSAHEQALKVKLDADGAFWVLVKGNKQPLPTSVAVKRGSFCPVKTYSVLGLGLDLPEGCVSSCGNFAPSQALTSKEIVKFKECEVFYEKDLISGEIKNFDKTDVSSTCSVFEGSVKDLSIQGLGLPAGADKVSFGDGVVSSGEESCNTRFVAGRYYTVCTP